MLYFLSLTILEEENFLKSGMSSARKLESILKETGNEAYKVTESVTFPCGFTFPKEIYENDTGEIKREEYRWEIYKKIKEKFGFHDNDSETEYFRGNTPSDSSFNISFAVPVPSEIKADTAKVNEWVKSVEKFVKDEYGCTYINWQGGERLENYVPKREFLSIQPEETKAALIEAGISKEDLYSNAEAMSLSDESKNTMLSASFAGRGGLTQKAFADNDIEIDLETANALENCFSQIEAITKYTADGHDLFNKGNGIDTISEHSIEYSEKNKAWFVHEKKLACCFCNKRG